MRRALFIILLPVCAYAQALTPFIQRTPCGFADMGRGCSGTVMWILQGGVPTSLMGTGNPVLASNGATLTTSRASNVYCATGGSDAAQLLPNPTFNPVGSQTGAIWSQTGTSQTTGAVLGPDGLMSGAQLAATATTGQHISFVLASNMLGTPGTGPQTLSLYAKQATAQFLGLNWNNAQSTVVDLSSGAVGNTVGFTSVTTTSAGGGWWRVVATTSSVTGRGHFVVAVGETSAAQADCNGAGGPSYTGTGKYLYVANAKLEAGSSATAYAGFSPVQALAQLGNNTPCLEPNGLRVEGAITNYALQSQALATTPWTAGSAVVAAPTVTNSTADVLAPDGTSTATKIVFPAVSGAGAASIVYQTATSIVGTSAAAVSVYLRTLSGTATVYVTTNSGASYAGTKACSVTSTWTRCAGTGTPPANNPFVQVGVDLRDTGQATQGAQTVYAWGFQAEQQSFASSYIPTTTTSATRAQDVITVPQPVTGSNWCAMATATPEDSVNGFKSSPFSATLSIGNNGSANSFYSYTASAGAWQLQSYDGAAGAKTYLTVASPAAAQHRLGACDSAGTVTLYVDGAAASQAAPSGAGTGVVSLQSTLTVGSVANNSSTLNGWLTNVCVGTSSALCTP